MRNLFLAVFLAHVLSLASASATPTKLPILRTTAKNLSSSTNNVGAWLQKLPQKALKGSTATAAATLIACSSLMMIGCDQGTRLLEVTDTEYVDPIDENAGQYVTFYIDDILYEGYWELTPDGQLLIEIDDGYDKLVLLEHMTGQVINNHHDIGAEVRVYGLRNGHEVDKYGEVVEVYDNGFYIIEIDKIVYVHNNQTVYTTEILLVNKAVLLEDGGFEFTDDI